MNSLIDFVALPPGRPFILVASIRKGRLGLGSPDLSGWSCWHLTSKSHQIAAPFENEKVVFCEVSDTKKGRRFVMARHHDLQFHDTRRWFGWKKEVELGRVWHILSLISKEWPSEEPQFFYLQKSDPLSTIFYDRWFLRAGRVFFSSVKQHPWCIRARNKGLRTGAVNYELTLNYDLWTIPFSVHCGWLHFDGCWEKGALFLFE